MSETTNIISRVHPNTSLRRELARQLHGTGIEFGPGCHPLPLGPFVDEVRYCDAFDRAGFSERFPEVGDDIYAFPEEIHYRIDFDKQLFVETMGKGAYDFVVANHVLEHLVNPLRFLEQCYELLDEGGLLYVGQPDKRRMFDRDRQRTPLADVVKRYQCNETVLSEARIQEYVNQVDQPARPFTPACSDYQEQVEHHRARSLHVNVWLVDDLLELFAYIGDELEMPWQLVDGIVTDDEFLLLFRKSSDPAVLKQYPTTLARLWHDSQKLLLERHYQTRLEELKQLNLALQSQLMTMDERLRESQNFIRRCKQALRSLPGAGWCERLLKRRRGQG